MIKEYCDICNKFIDQIERNDRIISKIEYTERVYGYGEHYDLCSDCAVHIYEYIEARKKKEDKQ